MLSGPTVQVADVFLKVIELFAMIAEGLPAATRALLGGRAHPGRGPAAGQPRARRADGDLASGMWRQAADARYGRDRSAAAAIGERAAEMLALSGIRHHAMLRTPPAGPGYSSAGRCRRRG